MKKSSLITRDIQELFSQYELMESSHYIHSVGREVIEKLIRDLISAINRYWIKPSDGHHEFAPISDYEITYEGDTLRLSFYGSENSKFMHQLEDLDHTLRNTYGWFLRFIDQEEAILEPIYSTPIRVPRFLYHVVTKDKLDKALEVGLIPRESTGNSSHKRWHYNVYPPRRFFSTQFDHQLSLGNVTLKIDTSQLQGVNFYQDTSWPHSVWTDQKIPPYALEFFDRST